jgi:1-pyrroline-5-carboxylate dehydrogenase
VTLTPFVNTPLTDFSDPRNADAMEAALARVAAQLGKAYPLWIGGQRVPTAETRDSIDPADPKTVVGKAASASPEHVEQAFRAATDALDRWRRTPAEVRARTLLRCASMMRARRLEFAAWMVYEVSKSWVEADADVAEAIDFLDFYAREMQRLGRPQEVTANPGEEGELHYIPLGIGVVIPPWNFPLAITVGMTAASVVAGNPTILKPASTAPVIAAKFVELFHEAGLPPGVLNFITGAGAKIGDLLVKDPRTRFVAFTGSKDVGLGIARHCGEVAPGQRWLKRSILEMGGKDGIIIDAEVDDLDAAIQGSVAAAFGFQGQKCSACSRLIVHEKVYDEVVKKVAAATEKLTVGHPRDRATYMGAMIDKNAFEKTLRYIEQAVSEGGRLVAGGKRGPEGGYFVRPTVIADLDAKARLMQEEVFGPVLAIGKARSWQHALEWANDTEYGLTGAVYSSNRAHLEEARHEFHVGNLYLNRKCTGALVGVHPFGGFNMSGTDSKAGGRDYLLLFTQAKVVAEKL